MDFTFIRDELQTVSRKFRSSSMKTDVRPLISSILTVVDRVRVSLRCFKASRSIRHALQLRGTKRPTLKMSAGKLLIPALVYKRRYILYTAIVHGYFSVEIFIGMREIARSRASYFPRPNNERIRENVNQAICISCRIKRGRFTGGKIPLNEI